MVNTSRRRRMTVFWGMLAFVLLAALYVHSYYCCSEWVTCPGTEWVIQCCTMDYCGESSWCDQYGGNIVLCYCDAETHGVIAICPPPV